MNIVKWIKVIKIDVNKLKNKQKIIEIEFKYKINKQDNNNIIK